LSGWFWLSGRIRVDDKPKGGFFARLRGR